MTPTPPDGPDLSEVVQDAFVVTLRERGAQLAADRLSLLDPFDAWATYFGPCCDRIEEKLEPGGFHDSAR